MRSERLGVAGVCDVVEYHASPHGVPIAGREGKWLPVPVEYKRGKSKEIDADRLQLCAHKLESMIAEMRALYNRGYTPIVKPTKQCSACSLKDICLPKLRKFVSAKEYTSAIWTVDGL